MTEAYENNGEYYADGSSDFKRKNSSSAKSDDDNEDGQQVNDKATDYIKELLGERSQIDRKYLHADRLLENEISKVQQSGRVPPREFKYVDIYREKPIRVTVKVLVPVKEHPKFNFVGKLLGPKGNSMKRLQDETLCKMAVLGRGSMKDRKKEEELRASLEPKYAHLNDELHVEISALAPPAEAHARIAYALAEVRKYLIPDSNDIIRQEQLREMLADGTIPGAEAAGEIPEHRAAASPYKKMSSVPRSAQYSYPPARTQTAVPARSPIPSSSRTVMPAKTKILSILDRARSAMEESYTHFEEPLVYEPPRYDSYSYSHSNSHVAPPPPSVQSHSRSRYEVAEYDPPEYSRDYYRESPSYAATHRMKSNGGGRI